MNYLTKEQVAFAVAHLDRLTTWRNLTQTQLEHLSGVKQSQISKIRSRQVEPSQEILGKLFQALGLKLDDIIHEAPTSKATKIRGYLATPLTGLPLAEHSELERTVSSIREVASGSEFVNPSFDLYWPGDYTHPLRHSDFAPSQVYLTDRSRASTFDFIVMFCASPSYGVGQENSYTGWRSCDPSSVSGNLSNDPRIVSQFR